MATDMIRDIKPIIDVAVYSSVADAGGQRGDLRFCNSLKISLKPNKSRKNEKEKNQLSLLLLGARLPKKTIILLLIRGLCSKSRIFLYLFAAPPERTSWIRYCV